MSFFKIFRGNQDGASALEFALILPVFAAMVFGTIQMGLAYYFAGSVQFALERTARLVMVNQDMTASEAAQAFTDEISTFTDQTITFTYNVDSSGDVPIAELGAVYDYQFVIPFVPAFDVTFDAQSRVPLDPTGL
jgi:Flp pilus assembly pilin Flp